MEGATKHPTTRMSKTNLYYLNDVFQSAHGNFKLFKLQYYDSFKRVGERDIYS